MKILSPIKLGRKFRKWGTKNVPLYSKDDLFDCLTQGFDGGQKDYTQFGLRGHDGLDFAFDRGTPVYASHAGTVTLYPNIENGLGVVIVGISLDGQPVRTHYWHHESFAVQSGQQVAPGDLIAYGDSTGYSTGHHLHFTLVPLTDNGAVLYPDNGFRGAVDPWDHIVFEGQMDKFDWLINALQTLEGYRDAGGSAYWAKRFREEGIERVYDYLLARLADKKKDINDIGSIPQ